MQYANYLRDLKHAKYEILDIFCSYALIYRMIFEVQVQYFTYLMYFEYYSYLKYFKMSLFVFQTQHIISALPNQLKFQYSIYSEFCTIKPNKFEICEIFEISDFMAYLKRHKPFETQPTRSRRHKNINLLNLMSLTSVHPFKQCSMSTNQKVVKRISKLDLAFGRKSVVTRHKTSSRLHNTCACVTQANSIDQMVMWFLFVAQCSNHRTIARHLPTLVFLYCS